MNKHMTSVRLLLRRKITARFFTTVLFVCGAVAQVQAQGEDARQAVLDAATAMGGVERIQSLRTLRLRGYGHEAYQDGGSEITTEVAAPEKMTNLAAYERVIDVPNARTRVKARAFRAFVFAARAMMQGQPLHQLLDGAVAYDVSATGTPRRAAEVAAVPRLCSPAFVPGSRAVWGLFHPTTASLSLQASQHSHQTQ